MLDKTPDVMEAEYVITHPYTVHYSRVCWTDAYLKQSKDWMVCYTDLGSDSDRVSVGVP